MLNDRLIGRISTYRRLLERHRAEGNQTVFSHKLAELGGFTPAQVRRDMMMIGHNGSPARGYDIERLVLRIGEVLDSPNSCQCALVGVGRLGQAILAYFEKRNPHLRISVAFDSASELVGADYHGCRCFDVSEITRIVRERRIRMGIVAVPADAAQEAASRLIRAGVISILNFAPVRLLVPPPVYVDDVDITASLERTAYHARTDVALSREDRA